MNLLVVDDEKDIKDLFLQKFRHEIRAHEINISFCNSGEEALSFLELHKSEAVLILSDINMPGMSGLELLKQIKTKFENPPPVVMMITAYGNDDSYSMAMKLGADDFLNKPLDFVALKEKLKMKLG